MMAASALGKPKLLNKSIKLADFMVEYDPPEHIPCSDSTEHSQCSSQDFEVEEASQQDDSSSSPPMSFTALRINYLLVTLAVMLADGLQGTHLYVLYESYGFSVASLYSLGFVTGAVTTPITGPLIDKFGRRRCAILYCVLEIGINMLEQYPFLAGLIVSRMVGGVTTNLLSSVFETWLDTEYRTRGFDEEKYEVIMRDSVVVSNLAAIASGYLAHILAERFGPVGPFQGAVSCTVLALIVIMILWTENYGGSVSSSGLGPPTANDKTPATVTATTKGIQSYMNEAFSVFRSDSRVLRVGIIQGLTVGSLQIFIFLWSPTLQTFSQSAPRSAFGLDSAGEPAYGLIFGAFMAAGVAGGLCSPFFRQVATLLLSPLTKTSCSNLNRAVTVEGQGVVVRPMAVEFLAAVCYLSCAILLCIPFWMDPSNADSFSNLLTAFLVYEFIVGVTMPCEGVIRSIYLPSDARATMMTLPRMIVNLAVSLGVILTKSIATQSAFIAVALLMAIAAGLQLSLISNRAWECLFGRVDQKVRRPARRLSLTALGCACSKALLVRSSPSSTGSPRSSSLLPSSPCLTSASDLSGVLIDIQDWCEDQKREEEKSKVN